MHLVEKLDSDFKEALKSKDSERLSILRLVRTAIKNLEIEKQAEASDEDVIAVIQREVKQHKESIDAFEKAGRAEEVARLQAENTLLETYLPEQLGEDALVSIVEQVIADTQATSMKDMGKVMGAVMSQVHGQTTGDVVKEVVQKTLARTE